MANSITVELLTTELFDVFTETFERVQGIYLDKGTSLFETLATITAEEASRPVSATCASIAAQVEHVRYYLDVLVVYAVGGKPEKVDWGEIWRTVQTVDETEWTAIQARLRASYQHVREVMNNHTEWDSNALAGALAMVVHTAYHLGEIRQALCVIKNG